MTQLEIQLYFSFHPVYSFEILVSLSVKERNRARRILHVDEVTQFVFVEFKTNQKKWSS